MPSKVHVQTDFSGGVVDRRIEGRTDADRYDKTMRKADNFVVTRSGTLRRRPGTVYLGDAFTRGGSDSQNNVSIDQDFRLVPWDTSDGKRSLLAISKTMVSLYENEEPGVGVTGLGTTARFVRPLKPTVDQPQSNRSDYQRHLEDIDEDLRTEKTELDTTKYFDTDLNNLRTTTVGDVCYIAQDGYQLHCCVKDSFYNPTTGNPDVEEGTENGIYNMPVSYIDGPYAFSANVSEPTTNPTAYGPMFSNRFPSLLVQAIDNQLNNFTKFPGVAFSAQRPSLPPNTSVSIPKMFGGATCMRLTTNFASTEENQQNIYTNLQGLETSVARHYDLPADATKRDLVEAINTNISCEHPCCFEQAGEDGKIKRFMVNVYGALMTGNLTGPQWADRWTRTGSDAHTVIDGNGTFNENIVVLLCRITNIDGHDNQDLGDSNDSEYPYYEGNIFRAQGTFKWGINVDKGVRAIHETQDRLGVVFEDDPTRVFYTRTSGFSIFSSKNNIRTSETGQLRPLTVLASGAAVNFPHQLRSRCYIDFGIGLETDVLAISSSDGFDVLPDGLNGSKIVHLKTMFDGVIIFAERGVSLLRGGSSRALDALSFVSRKINDEGAMRSCEPQDVESGIVYVDSTGSKLLYLRPASNADTTLSTQDVSYTSRNLLTPNAITAGGRGTPPIASVHKSMSLVSTPLNQARICRSDGRVVNFSIDSVGQFYAFTSFSQETTAQYNGLFLNYAQLVSKLGGYVFVANLADRSVINGLTRVGEILRETIDPDQGSPESLVCMDRMGVLVETNDKPPDPDGGGDPDDTESSRIGTALTNNFGQPSSSILLVQIENWLELNDEITIAVEGPSSISEFLNTDGSEINWSLLKAVVTSVAANGYPTVQLRLVSDNSVYEIDQDVPGDAQTGLTIQDNLRFTLIEDSGGGFLTGKSLASFPHLANEIVTVNGDGIESTTTLDSSGSTSLDIEENYEKFIGLLFASNYESMPLQRLSRLSTTDDSRITLKRIYRAFVKVIRSVGGSIAGRSIDYTEGEAEVVNNRYDGIVEHNIDSTHKIDETLTVHNNTSNMLEMASITYEIDSGGVS